MMVIRSEDKRLLEKLMEQEHLILNGFHFELVDGIGIVVARAEHVRGFWRYQSDRYAWTPAGNHEPTLHAKVMDDAVAFTLTLANPAP